MVSCHIHFDYMMNMTSINKHLLFLLLVTIYGIDSSCSSCSLTISNDVCVRYKFHSDSPTPEFYFVYAN